MKKLLAVVMLAVAAMSCTKIDPDNLLLGTWRLTESKKECVEYPDLKSNPEEEGMKKLSFRKGGRGVANGIMSFTYSVDGSTLTISGNSSDDVGEFEIQQLDADVLMIRQISDAELWRGNGPETIHFYRYLTFNRLK